MNQRPSPPEFSPMVALAKRALLWVVFPASVVGLAIYGLSNLTSPAQEEANRTARTQAKKLEEANAPSRAQAEALRKRIAERPDGVRNEAEMKDMTPQQRAIRRKELEDDWKRKNGIK